MDYLACAEDAAAIRRERLLDLAQRLCLKGYPALTERRRTRLWAELEGFLTSCLDEGATGWEDEDVYPCDYFRETFTDFDVSDRKFERDQENRFYSLLEFIARAAFDAVDDFAGGTYGWTIGDIKRVYDGQIPAWFNDGWLDREGNPVDLNSTDRDGPIFI